MKRLKICNRLLGLTLILILASGIQLEVTSGSPAWSVWVHIALGLVLTALAFYHIFLHYRKANWFARFAKNRNITTRVLWWVFLFTVVSGLAATVGWVGDNVHSPLGAVHGKIGFLMVIVAIVHVARHLRAKHRRKSVSRG